MLSRICTKLVSYVVWFICFSITQVVRLFTWNDSTVKKKQESSLNLHPSQEHMNQAYKVRKCCTTELVSIFNNIVLHFQESKASFWDRKKYWTSSLLGSILWVFFCNCFVWTNRPFKTIFIYMQKWPSAKISLHHLVSQVFIQYLFRGF